MQDFKFRDSEEINYVGKLYEIEQAPLDKEGYVQSFSLEEKEEISKFYSRFGFVIIRDVLNEECTQKSIEEMWDFIEDCTDGKCTRNDPTSWNDWPGFSTLGIYLCLLIIKLKNQRKI